MAAAKSWRLRHLRPDTGMRSLITIVLAALCGSALAGNARDALDYFSTVDSFSATFTQEVVQLQGGGSRSSAGVVKLLRPGRFIWQYKEPFEQIILADGERLWIHDIDLEQVTVKVIDEALGSAPIMLLSERQKLDAGFEIVEQESPEGLDQSLDWIELKPRVQDTEFISVMLGLDDKSIRQMVLQDQFSQQTVIKLDDVRLNDGVDPAEFRFEIPDGVDVIGNVE